MVLWLEPTGWATSLPTVTQAAFLNQQDVVQNEKGQGYDNVPYGHTAGVIGKLLYPEDHPYSWTVIGSFEDLPNATIEDIRESAPGTDPTTRRSLSRVTSTLCRPGSGSSSTSVRFRRRPRWPTRSRAR